jgi:MoxR-like ATPase
MTNEEITSQLSDCNRLKPSDLIIDDLQWKYLVWAVLRGKNILFVGPTRSGKTKAAKSVAKIYADTRQFFYFNLGSTQDARATLIGNTTFKKDEGTVFHPSEFVKAISTPNAIILLDELSRGHHDAWNILMPVLDSTQKYIRLDETEDSAVIPVAEGVSFIATANIGNEYTATRVMDKALTSRFPVIVEMKILTAKQEEYLLGILHPDTTDKQKESFHSIVKISEETKLACKTDNPKINTFITTDSVIEMANLVLDGFSLNEIAEMTIYPLYSEDGGQDCERLFVKQLTQKYIDVSASKTATPINDPKKGGKVRIPFK